MFHSQQIELIRARYNYRPKLKYQNCWLRMHLPRRKSMIQCLLKDLIKHCPFHKIIVTMAFFFCLRDKMFLCEIAGQKSFCGKLGISQDPVPVIRVLVKGDVRGDKQKDLSPWLDKSHRNISNSTQAQLQEVRSALLFPNKKH